MESRLQSNEVRIPKTTAITTTTNGITLSPNNITMSSSNSKRNENTIKTSPPGALDFDFNSPCQYFKSSFARSLSMNAGSNQTKSLDFGINFGLSRTSPIREEPQTPVVNGNGSTFRGDKTPSPPLSYNHSPSLTNGSPNIHHSNSSSVNTVNNSNNNNSARNVWSTSHKQVCRADHVTYIYI